MSNDIEKLGYDWITGKSDELNKEIKIKQIDGNIKGSSEN